ncbi:hypothetical protein SUGI_0945650 [Cryptomeria japonica]|nr:hypothetical protein SUGI_0945650 [Cryptomeria japonica]
MSKRSIEVTVLSARGLKRSNPLWKLQTLCVAWIDPAHKYCSKIDKLNDTHPIWNVNFSSIVDADADFSDAMLTVEVHSREPVFHFSKLECTASVLLKEFVAMADKAGGHSAETASFQLRSPSGKPRGVVDVSIRVGHKFQSHAVSPVTDRHSSYSGNANEEDEDEDDDKDQDNEEPVTAYPATLPSSRVPSGRPEDFPPPNYPYSYPPKMETGAQTERPNPVYRPPPPRPPAGSYWEAAPAPASYGPRPYGGGPYGYSNYPPPEPVLGGNNYFGLPNGRPNYGAGPQRPGLGLAAGAMAVFMGILCSEMTI